MRAPYDVITVGGGLGGAALAKIMAERGARVLVIERELSFADRVRGEIIMPWGVALIGDAAATSDPTWGQGMSLTLRDVHALSDALVADDDWERAGHAYAEAHDRHYAPVHRVDGWYADVFMEIGPEADARRARALPLIAADPTRLPDVPFSGPDSPAGDEVRARFFGE